MSASWTPCWTCVGNPNCAKALSDRTTPSHGRSSRRIGIKRAGPLKKVFLSSRVNVPVTKHKTQPSFCFPCLPQDVTIPAVQLQQQADPFGRATNHAATSKTLSVERAGNTAFSSFGTVFQ